MLKGGTVDSREHQEPHPSEGAGEPPWAHPDLRVLGRMLRLEMDETLRAEQHAARIAARRRSTMRDRLLMAEDCAELLHIDLAGGIELRGTVSAVGADHVVVLQEGRHRWVALHHVVAMRVA